MAHKSVSVIIPVYNQNSSLNVTLNFFNKLSYPNSHFEVIVIDDGSDEPVEDYVINHNNEINYPVRFIRQQNQGRASARNTGINHAKGEILIFNDADRFPHFDFISKHIGQITKDSKDKKVIIGCSYDYFGSYKQPDKIINQSIPEIQKMARKPIFYTKVTELYDDKNVAHSGIRWITFLVGNSCIKKADVDAIGGFDSSFSIWGAEHFDLAIRMVEHNYQFYLCEDAMNYHIPHSRDSSFYRANIEQSVNLLVKKYCDEKYNHLKEFLFGEISLQEMEKCFTSNISATLLNKPEILNIIH